MVGPGVNLSQRLRVWRFFVYHWGVLTHQIIGRASALVPEIRNGVSVSGNSINIWLDVNPSATSYRLSRIGWPYNGIDRQLIMGWPSFNEDYLDLYDKTWTLLCIDSDSPSRYIIQ